MKNTHRRSTSEYVVRHQAINASGLGDAPLSPNTLVESYPDNGPYGVPVGLLASLAISSRDTGMADKTLKGNTTADDDDVLSAWTVPHPNTSRRSGTDSIALISSVSSTRPPRTLHATFITTALTGHIATSTTSTTSTSLTFLPRLLLGALQNLPKPTRKLILDLTRPLFLRSSRPPMSNRGQHQQLHPAPRRELLSAHFKRQIASVVNFPQSASPPRADYSFLRVFFKSYPPNAAYRICSQCIKLLALTSRVVVTTVAFSFSAFPITPNIRMVDGHQHHLMTAPTLWPLFSIYFKTAEEEANKMDERWQRTPMGQTSIL